MKKTLWPRLLFILPSLLSPLLSTAQTALPEPVVHYTFVGTGTVAANSGTGGVVFDQTLAINTRDSVNLPAPTFGAAVGGPFGAAPFLDLSGATAMGNGYAQQAYIGNNAAATYQEAHVPRDAMTVTGWFLLDDALPSANQNVTIARCYVNSPKHGWQIIFPGNTGALRLGMVATAARNYDAPAATFSTGTGTWQFFAVTWTATGGAQWYAGDDTASGAPVAAGAANTNAFAYDAAAGTKAPLQLGAQSNQASGGALKGKLADIRIYDTALDAAQIAEIHASIKPAEPPPEPFIRWDFSALTTGSIPNNSRVANTGTGVGLTTSASDFNLRTDSASGANAATIYPVAGADGSGPFANGRALDLSLGTMAGTGVQTKLAVSQTAAGNFSEMTVTGWLNPAADLANNVTLFRNAVDSKTGWQITALNDRQLRLTVFDGNTSNGNLNSSGTLLATGTGTWQFIAVSWKAGATGTGGAQWYVGDEQNAPRADAAPRHSAGTGAMAQPAAYDLKLGCGGSGNAFKGALADIRIYDRALDAAQIAAVYDEAKPPPPPEPLVRYTFDDDAPVGDANTAPTAITNSGTLGVDYNIGASSIGAATRVTAAGGGAFGQGRALDLTQNPMNGTAAAYGTTASHASLTGLTALSVSFWLKVPELWTSSGIFVLRNNSGNDGWRVTTNSNGRLVLTVGNGTANRDFGSSNNLLTAADAGKWKFVTVVWDETATAAQWYVGDETAAPALASAAAAVAAQTMSAAAQQLNMGRAGTGSTGSLKAFLDDLRVYDTALTASQVQAVYDELKPDTPPIPPLAVTGFTPENILTGGTVTLTGSNFIDTVSGSSLVNDVLFATVSAGAGNWTVDSGTQITVTAVPAGIPVTGTIGVTGPAGVALAPGAYQLILPAIASFTPESIAIGGTLTVTGSNFIVDGRTLVTDVLFGDVSTGMANFTVVSGTQLIVAPIPDGIPGSAAIGLVSAGGTTFSTGTYTLASPFISGFAPGEIVIGDGVVLTGGNFMSGTASVITDVLFDTKIVGEGNFTVDSDTQITVRAVPGGIPDTGAVKVVTATGTFAAPAPYVIYTPPPAPMIRYTFEEADGAVAAANSGTLTGYNLTTFSGTVGAEIGADASGVAGKGRSLDLSTNQVNAPASPGAAITPVEPPAAYATSQVQTGLPKFKKMTITGWYRPNADVDVASLNNAYLLRHMGMNFHIYHRNARRLQARIGGVDFTTLGNDDGVDATAGTWKFFAVTWEEKIGAKFYGATEDREPYAMGETASAATEFAEPTAAGDIRIGHSNRNGGFPGFLDDIRIYDSTLTAGQVRAVYYEGKDAEPDSNILPYPPAWEASDAGDARRAAAHRAYLALIDRAIAAQGSIMPARILAGYGDGTVAGSKLVSRFTIGYALLQAYRASLVPADVTGGKKQTRDSYLDLAKKCLLATLNAAQNTAAYDATTTIADRQADELSFGLDTVVELYQLLAGLGEFTAPELADIEQKLALCADAVMTGGLEYGSFNRASSRGSGLAAVAAIPSLAAHAHRADWLQFANAIWNDWRHAAPAWKAPGAAANVIDTFEDARGYNGLWASTTLRQAVAMDRLGDLLTPETEAFFARFAHLVAPNGVMPDYGNCYWNHGLTFWLSAFERLGHLYQRSDFLENATAVAAFIARNPGMEIDETSALVDACRAVDATPAALVPADRPGAVVTTRTGDFGDVFFDKLYLRTGTTAADAYAAVDLHDGGYHGHEDGGALLLHTSGSSVLLHSQARLDTFANEMQGVWATRPGEDFLAPTGRHAPGVPTRWLVNFRHPGTYTGGPVLDPAKVSGLFFRAENTGATSVSFNLQVLSIKGVKPDGETVDLGLTANFADAGFTPGEVAFITVSGLSAPLDLSPYQYLLVEWQSSHPDYAPQFGFNGASFLPAGAADGRPATATLRTTAGSFTLDAYAAGDDTAPKGGLTRVMLDSAGRQIAHSRDLRLRKADGALLVLDTFEFTEAGDYTVGPVWHAQNLVSASGGTVVVRDDVQQYYSDDPRDKAAEPPAPLRYDFAAAGSSGTGVSPVSVSLVRSTYESPMYPPGNYPRHPQKEHFAATVTGARAAGDVVTILSVLRPGVPGTAGDQPADVPAAPSLMQPGKHNALFADATGQLDIGENPPPLPPVINTFSPAAVMIGAPVAITGYNFAAGGTSFVTDVVFGNVSAAGHYSVDSGTSITVSAVPAGIPDPGYLYVHATTGTATSGSMYSVGLPPENPVAPVLPGDVAEGADAILTAAAAGTPAPAYAWEFSNDNGATWQSISALDSAAYALSPDTATLTLKTVSGAMSSWQFRYIASNATGHSATSAAVTLKVAQTRLGSAPAALAFDAAGNLYVADSGQHVIRQITSQNDLLVLAGVTGGTGSTNGSGSTARFNTPRGLVAGADGLLYVADSGNHLIRRVSPDGTASTLAGFALITGVSGSAGWRDATGADALFRAPAGLAPDPAGGFYIADSGNHAIRHISPAGAVTTIAGLIDTATTLVTATIAGPSGTTVHVTGTVVTTTAISGTDDGPAEFATFNAPNAVAVGPDGSIYVADFNNRAIRVISPAPDRVVSTLAGQIGTSGMADGTGTDARFGSPAGLALDGGTLYVADSSNSTLRGVDTATGEVRTLAGAAQTTGTADATGTLARFNNPRGLALGPDGFLYIADTGNAAIRVFDPAGATVTTLTVTGTWSQPLPPVENHGHPGGENTSGGGAPCFWYFPALALLALLRRRVSISKERGLSSPRREPTRTRMSALLSLALAFLLSALQPFSPSALSQQPATGSVQGRVLNADTGDYIYQARVRVLSVADGSLRIEALTDPEGRYWLAGVPAGTVTVEAAFTGMPPVTTTVDVVPGQAVDAPTLNLSMTALASGPAAPDGDGKVVMLDAFVVESKRDLTGAAIALNSQRFAENIRNVVSIEEMGFTGDGSITGALKFLPGVELENDDSGFGNAITLSGAPSANVPVTVGGLDAISSSYLTQNEYGNANQRSVNLMQLSANNISRVEVNRSPTPDSPGSALAGSVNLVPKSAFERARPQYTVQLFGSANAKSVTLSQRSAPLNGTQTPVHAGAAFSAIVPLSKRLGFSLNLTHSVSPKSYSAVTRSVTANYNALSENQSEWGYLNDDPATGRVYKYYLHAFDLYDNNSTYTRDSVNLTVDYKLTRNSTLSLGWTQSYNEQQNGQRRASWDMGRARINWGASTTGDEWTGAATDRVTNTPASLHDDGTQVVNATTYNDFIDKNRQFSLKYRWRTHDWAAELLASQGEAGRTSVDLSRDLLFGGWSVVDTVNITFADIQKWDIGSITAAHNGVPVSPFDLASLYSAEGGGGVRAETVTINTTRDTVGYTSLPRFRIKPDWTGDRKVQLAGSLSRNFDIGHTYHIAKLGFDYNDWKRDQRYDEAFGTGGGFYYDGIDVPYTGFVSDGYNRVLPLGYGVLPSMDLHKMALFYKANPGMFKSINPGNDYVTAVINNKYFRETITSAYLRVDSSFLDHRLLVVWGLRAERTDDEAEGAGVDPSANRALRPDTGLMDYIYPRNSLAAAKLIYTPRGRRAEKSYTDLFPSVNARYNLTANLVARASYSQTIGRPDVYNIVPGVVSNLVAVSSGDMAIRVTNPNLDPWKSQNISLSLELYSDKIGDLTLRGYRRWINDAYADRTLSVDDSRDIIEFYGLDLTEFPNAYLVRPERIPGTLVTSGLELSGRYNLDPLLPNWARGLRVRFNISRSTITGGDELAASFGAQKMYLFPWSAGGSLTLERKYFTVAVSGKWNDTQRRAYYAVEIGTANGRYAPGTYEYIQPTFRLDLDLTVKLTKNLSLFINGRDINNYTQEHLRYAPDTPELLKAYRRLQYEAVWTAGMKAVF
ncbi:TonB-dependent receptor [Termitidicoccus mucosus]|uniref:LamG-like jellyroll fold domain-containing protein n=1 Tax=Termitidicoccus mucosus TaxID=1184151 RepID=A0A178IIH7_9BACT|nr:hypothetical protein AW736_15395 [Opitutaceae bacterium TSB47]